MSKHVTWDYEESLVNYYHIYPVTGEGEELMGEDAFAPELPQTKESDDDIQKIVNALDRLAERL